MHWDTCLLLNASLVHSMGRSTSRNANGSCIPEMIPHSLQRAKGGDNTTEKFYKKTTMAAAAKTQFQSRVLSRVVLALFSATKGDELHFFPKFGGGQYGVKRRRLLLPRPGTSFSAAGCICLSYPGQQQQSLSPLICISCYACPSSFFHRALGGYCTPLAIS